MLIALSSEELAEAGRTAEQVFAHQMRRLRTARGLSQADLAERVSSLGGTLYQQTIAKIESGQRSLRLSEADLIAQALGSSVTEMLSRGIDHSESNVSDLEAEGLIDEIMNVSRRRQEAEAVLASTRHHMERVARQFREAQTELAALERTSARVMQEHTELVAKQNLLVRAALQREAEMKLAFGDDWRQRLSNKPPLSVEAITKDARTRNQVRELEEYVATAPEDDPHREAFMKKIDDLRRRLGIENQEGGGQ